MNTYINFNGRTISSGTPIVSADNRGFRYGDGIFETIRISAGKIILASSHFDRLFSGIKLLRFEQPSFFTAEVLNRQILDLCKKNNHLQSARVRLVIYRGEGGLYDSPDPFPNHIIQTWDLPLSGTQINENGWVIDVFPGGRKSPDIFSNLKSNNYLLYSMAALYAMENHFSDCLLLNTQGRICDSTVANIFCRKNNIIFTPPLSEGCVAGVIRRHLLEKRKIGVYEIQEAEIEPGFLESADEVFLTNAIQGIRWVNRLGAKSYDPSAAHFIYDTIIKNLS